MIFDIVEVEEKIGYIFKDKILLRQAFTHPSYANENKCKDNQNLEYLGDSILNFVVAEYLYNLFPASDEGDLSKKRASIVSAEPLAEKTEELKLDEDILLGEGEKRNGKNRMNINSDLFEAVIAGIYLDGGMENSANFIKNKLLNYVSNSEKTIIKTNDSKTSFQEVVQKMRLGAIEYKETNRSGPDHSPIYNFDLFVGGKLVGTGSGNSKKQAQQNAASKALRNLNGETKPKSNFKPNLNGGKKFETESNLNGETKAEVTLRPNLNGVKKTETEPKTEVALRPNLNGVKKAKLNFDNMYLGNSAEMKLNANDNIIAEDDGEDVKPMGFLRPNTNKKA